MKPLLALLAAAALCGSVVACDDDGAAGPPGGTAGSGGSAGSGGGPAALEPCLERPNELPRPPVKGLPCELLPPDFSR